MAVQARRGRSAGLPRMRNRAGMRQPNLTEDDHLVVRSEWDRVEEGKMEEMLVEGGIPAVDGMAAPKTEYDMERVTALAAK